MTTKSELAAQKCADLVNDISKTPLAQARDYLCGPNGFRRFVEHVSDLIEEHACQHCIGKLEELVLREPVDPIEAEAKKWANDWAGMIMTPHEPTRLERLETLVFAALRRGREIERGEGK